MERILKLLLLLAVAGFAACIILFLYSNSRLNEAIARLETAERTIDTSIKTLSATSVSLDTVQRRLFTFGTYVHDIQRRVEILDLNERAESNRFRNQRAQISSRLQDLYRDLEMTGRELPEIPVVQE